jgi:hypothetical protein
MRAAWIIAGISCHGGESIKAHCKPMSIEGDVLSGSEVNRAAVEEPYGFKHWSIILIEQSMRNMKVKIRSIPIR